MVVSVSVLAQLHGGIYYNLSPVSGKANQVVGQVCLVAPGVGVAPGHETYRIYTVDK